MNYDPSFAHSDGAVLLPKIYADIETISYHPPPKGRMVEFAAVNENGEKVFDDLIHPGLLIGDAKTYVGITDELLKNKEALEDRWPGIEAMCRGNHFIFWNADHDVQYFPNHLRAAGHISCAMTRFAGVYGEWNEHWGNYTFKGLDVAADYFNLKWEGRKHRALPDAKMTKAVWDAMDRLAMFGNVLTLPTPSNDNDYPF